VATKPPTERRIVELPRGADGLFEQPSWEKMSAEERADYARDMQKRRMGAAHDADFADEVTGIANTNDPTSEYVCQECNRRNGTKCVRVAVKKLTHIESASCDKWEIKCVGDPEHDNQALSPEEAGFAIRNVKNGKFGCPNCTMQEPSGFVDELKRTLWCRRWAFTVNPVNCCGKNSAGTLKIDADGMPLEHQPEPGKKRSVGSNDTLKGVSVVDRMSAQMEDRSEVYAPTTLGKTRSITPEGYMLCEGVAIARTGTQVYGAHELPLEPGPDGKIRVYRLPEEVFREETMLSFVGKPVTVEHPNGFVTPETWQQQAVGIVQNVRRGTGIEDDLLLADILITAADAILYVAKELPELSCGYNCDYEQTEPGRATQRNIVGNHTALVDRGRAGPRCAIKDHAIEETVMQPKGSIAKTFARLLTAFQAKDEKGIAKELKEIEDDDPDEGTGMLDAATKSQLKEAMDYIKERKAKDAAEEKEKADKKMAEDSARKEAEEAAAKDAILSAEVLPKDTDLGKVWTGDSAAPAIKEILARAEILAPGISIPSTDSVNANAVKTVMVNALAKADTTDAGKECIKPFLMGRELKTLDGRELLGVFNGAAELMRVRNNSHARPNSFKTNDFSKPTTPQSINEENKKFWAAKSSK
jgi:uncharacterized protein